MLKNKKVNLTLKKKELLFKSTHRGTKELDYLIGNFVLDKIDVLTEKDLNDLELILSFNDVYLFRILTEKERINKKMDVNLVKKIIKFNKRFKYDS